MSASSLKVDFKDEIGINDKVKMEGQSG